MNLLRHTDIALPEFSEDAIARSKRDLIKAAAQSSDSFCRSVKIGLGLRMTDDLTLDEAISIADGQFQLCASMCGAIVVDHTYGLAKVSPRRIYTPPHPMIPSGYELVAQVSAVPKAEPMNKHPRTQTIVKNGTSRYIAEHMLSGWWYWSDADQCQFVVSTERDTTVAVLIDIDLCLSKCPTELLKNTPAPD